ncbi:MAG: hypothetical protein ABR541_06910 [Candidatus Dormibacteria bacterium]
MRTWTLTRMTGYAIEFKVSDEGTVRCHQKPGRNVGVNALPGHHPGAGHHPGNAGIGEEAVVGPLQRLDALATPG